MNGLQIKNVTKTYKEGNSSITALNHASMDVKPGEFVAIVGPSGSVSMIKKLLIYLQKRCQNSVYKKLVLSYKAQI